MGDPKEIMLHKKEWIAIINALELAKETIYVSIPFINDAPNFAQNKQAIEDLTTLIDKLKMEVLAD